MIKNKNIVLTSILLFIIYLTHNWINFFYNSTNNDDFSKYYDFINYFLGLDVVLDYGQGTLYYFLVSLIIKSHLSLIGMNNIELIVSTSVQELNLFLYLIGVFGLYKLLEEKGFNKKIILLSLIFINFFPQTIYLRAVMKPEILVFAIFPWCLFSIELYIKSKNIKNLYLILPSIILIINSKPSLAAMAIIYLILLYYQVFKILDLKQLTFLTFLFLALVCAIQFENYKITKLLPFDRVYEQEYDNKADFDILIRFNLLEVFKNPDFKYDYQENFYSVHAKSVINITILDTFGDHFNQLFDSQLNYFSRTRKQVFVNNSDTFLNDNRQINYSGPLSSILVNNLDKIRKSISSIFSILFYTILIYFSIKNKSKSKYFLAPFVGIIILYINSLGFPSNNFNPYKGDTFKAFYYSFLLVLALVFLICELFTKNSLLFNAILTLIFSITIIFISGHPKENNQLTSERIIVVNEYSIFCNINNLLFLENNLIKLVHPSGNIENYKSDCENKSTSRLLFNENFYEYEIEKRDLCFHEGQLNKDKSNLKDCRIFWINEAKRLEQSNKIPILSVLCFAMFLIINFLQIDRILKNFKKNRKV